MLRGVFVTFEGIDGCGKTTQAERVERILRERGVEALRTAEPGGTPLGVKLRRILLEEEAELCPEAELFLFLADRAEHVRRVIRPALEEGKVVLCDRYYHSTLAYQGGGRGLPMELVGSANEIATGGLEPDLVVLLDLEPESALRRIERKDRVVERGIPFLKRVREAYLEMAEGDDRFLVLDGERGAEELSETIAGRISALMGPGGRPCPTSPR